MPSQILMYADGGGAPAVTNPAATFAGVSGVGAPSANEASLQFEVPLAGTISDIYVRVLANDSAVDQSVAVRVNGSNQAALTVTVTAGAGAATYSASGSVAVTAGQLISIGITSGAGAGSVTYSVFSIIYTINTPNTAVQVMTLRSGGAAIIASGSSGFFPIAGTLNHNQTAVTSAAWILRFPTSFTYLRAYVTGNPGTTASTVALYVDGADTALSATLTAATSGEFLNTASTVTVTSGSSVSIRLLNNNNNAGTSILLSHLQLLSNSKWTLQATLEAQGGRAITSRTASLYFPLNGRMTSGQTSESNVQATARKSFNVQNLQVLLPTNGAGTTFAFRSNTSNLITMAISSGQVGYFVDSSAATVTSADLIALKMDCSTAGVTGGWTVTQLGVEMASIDDGTLRIRTLVGAGI